MISLRSALTRKLLSYFFEHPRKTLYINEIWRNLHLDKRNLVKKIKALEKEGILKHENIGNLKLYSLSKDYPFYNEYRNLVMNGDFHKKR